MLSAMAQETVTIAAPARRVPGRGVLLVNVIALAGAAAVVALTADSANWNLSSFMVILAFTTVSGLAYVDVGTTNRLSVSGTMLGLVLAAVVLGGGPAAVIGAVATGVRWLRSREPFHAFANNLVTFTWFPLLAGLLFHGVVDGLQLGTDDVGYYLTIFPVFFFALLLNFVGIVGYQCYLDRVSLWERAIELVPPMLAAEMLSAMLTMAAVFFSAQTGSIGLALLGLILVTYQYLVGELLKSKGRATELQRVATTDDLTGLANRERFRDRLEERVTMAEAAQETFAVMLIDLDRFKEVNDTLGHHYGDELLARSRPAARGARRRAIGVARLGGDEFAVMPEGDADDTEMLERIATRLIDACRSRS